MNEPAVRVAISAGCECASTMVENALYIEKELANVQLSDALRARTRSVCGDLLGTYHDVCTEAAELEELLRGPAQDCAIARRLDRIVRWLGEDIEKMHALVRSLDAARAQDAAIGLAYLLVTESATAILESYNRASAAVSDALEIPPAPHGQ